MGRRGTSAGEVRNKKADGPGLSASSLALALEPRFMYDAAGGVTAAAVAKQADPVPTQDNDHAYSEPTAGKDASAAGADGHVPADVGPFGSKGEAQLVEAAVAQKPITEIVFVDARLPDQDLMHARDGIEVIALDPTKDGIAQISEALAGRSDISAIHIFSHGDSGKFTLGGTQVDSQTLMQKAGEFASWSASLSQDADIMIWGCDVAALPGGQALINSLSSLTGADVAASDDATGSALKGGDWDLEARTGSIEADLPFAAAALADWSHLLGAPTVSGTEVIRVTEPSTLNQPGSSSTTLGDAGYGLSYDSADAADTVTLTVKVADTGIGTLTQTGSATETEGGWTFTGSLADANAWLKALTFNAADAERGNATGKTTITVDIVNITDGTPNVQRTISVEVTPSNDPVTLDDVTVPVQEINPDGSRSVTTIGADFLRPNDPEVTLGTQSASQIIYRLDGSNLPQYGFLTLNGQRIGAGSVFTHQDVIDGKLQYVHTATGADQNLADSFSVSINDGATPIGLSDTATVHLDITPVNQAPTVSGGGSVYEGQPANDASGRSQVGLFINADNGGDPNDPLSVQLTSLAQHGKLFFTGEAIIGGEIRTLSNYEITAADITNGFVFAYAARGGLTYANNGVDDPVTRRPPNDSFGVTVRDSGGGAGSGQALNASATINLNILPVDDNPVWVETSSQEATVPAPTGNSATDYRVTLDATMLNVTDVDSLDASITFVVTSQDGLERGRLYVIEGGTPRLIPIGGTFTLADVKAGRVQYWQHLGADAGDVDTFNFQVLDNATTLNWRADGTTFERLGGVYADEAEGGALRDFTFTIRLHDTPGGEGGIGSLPPQTIVDPGTADQTHAGTNTSGQSYGSLTEGGSVRIYGSADGSNRPYLNYSVGNVEPDQVVYTVVGFNGTSGEWNGQLQRYVGGDISDDASWVTVGLYEVFTQADLDAGHIRFVHDGGEDFDSSVVLNASAGVLISDGSGGLVVDQKQIEFFFYARPVNDDPTAAGSGENVIREGDTTAITRDMLQFGDADDAISETHLETAPTLPGGSGNENYALNHDGSNPLTFKITDLPDHGNLFYFDGTTWIQVTTDTVLHADWITDDPATTRLRYVHDGEENFLDGFRAQATDRWGATSDIVSVDFVITPVNDAPQIAEDPTAADPTGPHPSPETGSGGTNEPLELVYEGSFSRITPDMLQAVDPDSTSSQVQYRITTAPAHGRIAYSTDGVNFSTLGVGSAFTQADVAAGRIYYLHNGDEPNGTGYDPVSPGTPDDTFTFTLSDGAAEQTGREFWIYVRPTNDAPVVSGPTGPIDSTNTSTEIPGFSVSDPDLTAIIPGYETDFVQVVVRLLHSDGTAFSAGEYSDVTIGFGAVGGLVIDGDKNGAGDYLVLRGTRAQINGALDGLSVSFADNRDEVYQVQVIADDRIRNPDGSLTDFDTDTPGIQADANGGGMRNQPQVPLTGTANAIPTNELNYYADAVPTTGALIGNISAATVTIRASSINDLAELTADNPANVYEDQATNIGSQIGFHISDAESDAFGTPVTVTLSVPSGTLNVGAILPTGIDSVGGRNTGTLTITGIASDIEAFLNNSLTYTGASNVNHDLNGSEAGDVTLTVSFDDTGSNIGSNGVSNNPSDIAIALTIVPVNDRPTVDGGGAVVPLTGATSVPGFSVGDVDVADDGGPASSTAGETDILEVTVRITGTNGTPLASSAYSNGGTDYITIGSTAGLGGLVIDGTNDGTGSALVLRGTLADINAYLDGLTVEITGPLTNQDTTYRVEVIVDDRVRDPATGALTGTAANGGENDNGSGGTTDVPTAEFDIYGSTTAQINALGLTPNVNWASRDVLPTSVNDPAHVDVPTQQGTEGSATYQFDGIVISDADALSDTLDVTVTLDPGFTFAASSGVTEGSTTATFSGSITQINTWINSLRVNLPTTDGLATDWNGSFDVRIVVDDNGNNGGRPPELTDDTDDPRANPGDFSYEDGTSNVLVTTRDFTVTIAAVNDAPVVDSTGGTAEQLPTIDEGTPAGSLSGDTVDNLFSGYFGDSVDQVTGGSSQDAFIGVLVTGLTENANQGVWQYSLDGITWTAIGARTDANALYLQADAHIRFVPAVDFHGTPHQITVRLVENDTSSDLTGSPLPANGGTVDVADAVGGTTRYSVGTVTLGIQVDNVNDRPSIGNGTLPTVVEDTSNPGGQTVTELFGGSYSDAADNQSDPSIGGGNAAGTLGGIAIVGNDATADQGRWQYFAGGVWVDIPTTGLGDGNALLLTAATSIRFLPAADFNGTPGSLEVRATDQTVAAIETRDISGEIDDGASSASHWSVGQTLETAVSAVNDAPVIGGTTLDGSAASVTENAGVGTGTTSVNLISGGTLSDVDPSTTPGLASGIFGAGQIEISLDAYVTGDRLEVTGLPAGVTVDATENGNGRSLVIHLDADTTIAEVEAILNAITFRNTSDNPTSYGSATTRTYHVLVRDGANTDVEGDTAGTGGSLASNTLTGTILIAPVNDPPVAEDNVNEVTEDGAPATGNVITEGTSLDSDPDNDVSELAVTQISNGTDIVTPTGGEMVIEGKYGTLTIGTDGGYTYALDPDNPAVNALKDGETLQDEVFTYTLSDPAGGTDTATLTITINGVTDGEPSIVPVDGNGAATGHNTVSEAGLPGGSTPAETSESVSGSITVSAADGLESITISDGAGGTVTLDVAELAALGSGTPVTITTAKGVLTLTGFTAGTSVGVPTSGSLTYTYVLTSAQSHENGEVSDAFTLSVTDAGGDTDTGTLTILIADDAPVARADANEIQENDTSVSGNVFGSAGAGADDVADSIGADGSSNPVTGVSFGGTSQTVGGAGFDTTYGHIIVNADGSYTYKLDNTNAVVNALKDGETLTEVVEYTITDADGDTSTATLTITINGVTDGEPSIAPVDGNGAATGHNTVNEAGLPGGSTPAETSESVSGSITVSAADGLESITISDGVDETVTLDAAALAALGTSPVTITTAKGVLTLTGFTATSSAGVPTSGTLTYTYLLTSAQSHENGEVSDAFTLSVTDAGGDTNSGTLTILIADDAPIARADANEIQENDASVNGNVFGSTGAGSDDVADSIGADGSSNPVTGVSFGGTSQTVGAGFDTAYGSIVVNSDGSYTYTLDNANAAVNALKDGETLTEVVEYTITDADGDTSTATLTITINGVTDGDPSIVPADGNGAATGHNTVNEAGLVNAGDDSETTTGSISIDAQDGLGTVTIGGRELDLAELNNLGTTSVFIDTGEGTLELTLFTPGTTVGGVPVDGTIAYTYTLKAAQSQSGATESTDEIALVVRDAGGGTSTGTLTIRIVDDAPTADDDTNSVTEDGPSTISGNVVGNDRIGADGNPEPVTDVSFGGAAQPIGGTGFDTTYGHIVVNADGSYSYTLDNTNPTVNALLTGQTLTEVVEYTITDGDGDTSSATLTITINGSTDGAPAITPVDGNGAATGEAEVHEKGLGDAGDGSETTTGTIVVSTPDGLKSVTVGGTVVSLAELGDLGTTPVIIDTGEGTLVLTGFTITATIGGVPTEGTLSYTYTLKDAQSHPGAVESTDIIDLVVTDAADVSNAGTLTVRIVDDVPTANNDANSITEDGPSTISGNVVGNDRIGADVNPSPVTGVSFGGHTQPVGDGFNTAYGSIVVNADGSYTYTLDNTNAAVNGLRAGQTLTEVVEYTITDGDGDTSTARLTITINGSNDGPTVVPGVSLPDRTNADSDNVPPVDVKGVFTDVDAGDTLTYTATGLPPGLTIDPVTGLITGTLATSASQGGPGRNGVYTVTVTAKDAAGATISVSFNWNVSNPPPVAVNDSNRTDRNTPVGGNVLTGLGRDHDPDGDSIKVTGVGTKPVTSRGITVPGSDGGTFTIHPDGRYTFNPGRDFLGLGALDTATTSISYTITDADGATATAILIVTVRGVTEAPLVTDLPGYDRWGFMSEASERDWGVREDEYGYLEGRPVDRYTSTWRTVSQQVVFRQWGSLPTTLFFEARLGRNQMLPSWISFDASTQTVTANPTDQIEPGIYVVRVVAKDINGREAEASVTIHILRDNAKSLEMIQVDGRTTAPQEPAAPVPQEGEPATPPEEAPAPTDAAPEAPPAESGTPAEQPAEEHSALPVPDRDGIHVAIPLEADGDRNRAEEQGSSRSLTRTLLQQGSTGQMIAAARFLEALAADTRTHH